MSRTYVLLYDRDCGFCERVVRLIYRWSRSHSIRLVPLQDPVADQLLSTVELERRMASWHIVTPEGAIYSAGQAVPVILHLIPGLTLVAKITEALPRLVNATYSTAARHRHALSKCLGVPKCQYRKGVETMHAPSRYNWRLFFVLWAAGFLASVAILPYKVALRPPLTSEWTASGLRLAADVLVNGVLIAGTLTYLGLRVAKSVGLGVPIIECWVAGKGARAQVRRILVPGLLGGVMAMLVMTAVGVLYALMYARYLPQPATDQPVATAWQVALASLYGGITEELTSRLGVMSIAAWALTKLGVKGNLVYWAANVVAAFQFGLGHLPATAGSLPLENLVVAHRLLLNGVSGLIFGHLYWTRGLEASMLAHFTVDVLVHVLPSLAYDIFVR